MDAAYQLLNQILVLCLACGFCIGLLFALWIMGLYKSIVKQKRRFYNMLCDDCKPIYKLKNDML